MLAVLAAGVGTAAAAERPLTFAPLPMENPDSVARQVRPMLNYLEKKLGVAIRVAIAADYGEVLKRFEDGEVDIAYLGPLPYMALRQRVIHAEPIVHFLEPTGGATYTCALVAWGNTPVPGREARPSVALTQPLSTCGYLSTSALLRDFGHDIDRLPNRYLDAHDAVALAVVRGEFDLGGMKTAIARKFAHLGLRVKAETAPLPSFALVVNTRTVEPRLVAAVRDALTILDPQGADSAMMADWGPGFRHGAIRASDSDYASVRALGSLGAVPGMGRPR